MRVPSTIPWLGCRPSFRPVPVLPPSEGHRAWRLECCYGPFRASRRPKMRTRGAVLLRRRHSELRPGPSYERRVSVDQLAPFSNWADEAVAGRKLFALTHSSIGTTYASTTETADFLLAQESLERKAATTPPPRPGMAPIYRADGGDFHVMGFAGVNEQAPATTCTPSRFTLRISRALLLPH